LALLNALFRAADARGIHPAHDEIKGRFVFELEGTCIRFAVRERLEDEWRDRVRWDGKTEKEKFAAATGRLFIAVYKNGYDSRQVAAEADGTWKDLSAALFQPLYRKVVVDREQRREGAERERRQEEYRAELKRQEQERADREERAQQEKAKEKALLVEARNWQSALLLRGYIAARLELAGADAEDWARWASSVADRLDPLKMPAEPRIASGCNTADAVTAT
jgi:hypothetical protein